MERKKISVVIPTYNRLPSLKECLLSVLENDYPNFEIIVVDDFSKDGTREYLKKIKDKNENIKNESSDKKIKIIINNENLGVAEARNAGIKVATGEWVAFIDDDCRAEKNWLSELEKCFTEEKLGFVIGNTIYFQENYRGNFPERLVNNNCAQWPGAGNIAYRKKVLDEIGGFDGVNFPYANEDTELALRAFSAGWKYVSSKKAKVYHQKAIWNVSALWRSAHNFSAWPLLKKKYPRKFQEFKPDILGGVIFAPKEYFYLLFLPIVLPLLMIRYFLKGTTKWKIFFTKWPGWLILKRIYLWREAIRQKTLIL